MNRRDIKVYVAGAYSADNVIDVLKNIGIGEEMAARLFQYGFSPFCPWHDADFIIKKPYNTFAVKDFYEYSLTWLKVCDVILLLPSWQNSDGAIKEATEGKKLGIPIFTDFFDLIAWAGKK